MQLIHLCIFVILVQLEQDKAPLQEKVAALNNQVASLNSQLQNEQARSNSLQQKLSQYEQQPNYQQQRPNYQLQQQRPNYQQQQQQQEQQQQQPPVFQRSPREPPSFNSFKPRDQQSMFNPNNDWENDINENGKPHVTLDVNGDKQDTQGEGQDSEKFMDMLKAKDEDPDDEDEGDIRDNILLEDENLLNDGNVKNLEGDNLDNGDDGGDNGDDGGDNGDDGGDNGDDGGDNGDDGGDNGDDGGDNGDDGGDDKNNSDDLGVKNDEDEEEIKMAVDNFPLDQPIEGHQVEDDQDTIQNPRMTRDADDRLSDLLHANRMNQIGGFDEIENNKNFNFDQGHQFDRQPDWGKNDRGRFISKPILDSKRRFAFKRRQEQ